MKTDQKSCFDNDGNFIIRPYLLKELATHYNINPRTLRRWIDNLAPGVGKTTMKYFTIDEVRIIVTALGVPQKVDTKKAA